MSNQDYDAVIKWIKNDSAKADSILAAGQIISSGQQTNSALRVQAATCMATDQAAGVNSCSKLYERNSANETFCFRYSHEPKNKRSNRSGETITLGRE